MSGAGSSSCLKPLRVYPYHFGRLGRVMVFSVPRSISFATSCTGEASPSQTRVNFKFNSMTRYENKKMAFFIEQTYIARFTLLVT